MIELFADAHDDLDYLEMIQSITNGMVDSCAPQEVYLTHVQGWFDQKWMAFSGKALGAVGYWKRRLTVPPFHPRRIKWQKYYRRLEAELEGELKAEKAYALAVAPRQLHIYQESSQNFAREISRVSASALLIWFCSDTLASGRGSLMVYHSAEDQASGWFCSLDRCHGHWQPRTRHVSIEEIRYLEARGRRLHEPNRSAQWRQFNELLVAVQRGDLLTTDSLLDEVDAAGTTDDGNTLLMAAALHGQTAVMELLLRRHADPNARTDHGSTALMKAASGGHLEAVRLLLDQGAAIEARNWSGKTALTRAAFEGHTEVVELLLDRGADINAKLDVGATALHFAAGNGHAEVVQLLIERGADVKVTDYKGRTALWFAQWPRHTAIVQHLQRAVGE